MVKIKKIYIFIFAMFIGFVYLSNDVFAYSTHYNISSTHFGEEYYSVSKRLDNFEYQLIQYGTARTSLAFIKTYEELGYNTIGLNHVQSGTYRGQQQWSSSTDFNKLFNDYKKLNYYNNGAVAGEWFMTQGIIETRFNDSDTISGIMFNSYYSYNVETENNDISNLEVSVSYDIPANQKAIASYGTHDVVQLPDSATSFTILYYQSNSFYIESGNTIQEPSLKTKGVRLIAFDNANVEVLNINYNVNFNSSFSQYFRLGVNVEAFDFSEDSMYNQGYNNGYLDGKDIGYTQGQEAGYNNGFETGEASGVLKGFNQGRNEYGIYFNNEWRTAGWYGTYRYNQGVNEEDSTGFIALLFAVFSGFGTLLSIELLPNITIGAIIAVPLVFGILWFILGKRGGDK